MKKIVLLLLVGILGLSTGIAKSNNSVIEQRVKNAFDNRQFINKQVQKAFADAVTMQEIQEDEGQAGGEARAYLQGLMYAADAVEDINWYDNSTDIHAILMKADPSDESISFYQYLVNEFTNIYKTSPLQGSLDQYQDFYQKIQAKYPKSFILSTIGIWATNNLFATLPFLESKPVYWYIPTEALDAYNVMGLVDGKETLKMVLESMTSQHGVPPAADGSISALKREFFSVWRNQDDPDLPCVKDANKLEGAVINAAK